MKKLMSNLPRWFIVIHQSCSNPPEIAQTHTWIFIFLSFFGGKSDTEVTWEDQENTTLVGKTALSLLILSGFDWIPTLLVSLPTLLVSLSECRICNNNLREIGWVQDMPGWRCRFKYGGTLLLSWQLEGLFV